MDEKKAGREMRNSNPQFEFNLLRRQHFCFIPRGSCGGVGGVGGSYWFGKYYDGRSPGFLFIITAMSPPFCAGIPGNYNTSNWCFNSSGHHRQVNTRLEVAPRLACSHTRRERRDHLQINLRYRYHCHVNQCHPGHCPFICLIFYPSIQERKPFYQSQSVSLIS